MTVLARQSTKYAAIVCQQCRRAWTIETRFEAVTCPRCTTRNEAASRRPIWAGDDPSQASQALLLHNGGPGAAAAVERPPSRARALPHESPAHAAASAATGIVNRSDKAEAVARFLAGRGAARHDDLLAALAAAGLDAGRAHAEVVRMLAMDVLMEPRPGVYRMVG